MSTSVEGLTTRRKTVVLATCCLSLLIVSMDATIVNVAIPTVRADLHASLSRLQWIIDIYTLTLASLLLLAGAAADRVGRRRVFQIGLVGFAAGPPGWGPAPRGGALGRARGFQGHGGCAPHPGGESGL